MMRNVMTVAGFGLALVAGSAFATPPVKRHIDPDANWMIHLDLDSMDETEIGSFFMEMIAEEADNFEEIQQIIPGFWPGPDGGIFGITLYGSSLDMEHGDGPEDFCAIVYGDDQISGWGQTLEQVAAHEGVSDEIKTRVVHGCDVWSVPFEEGRLYAGLVESRDNVAWVIAFDSDQIADSLAIITQDEGGTDMLPRGGWRDGTIAYLSTNTFDGVDLDEASVVIGEVQSVRARIGEEDGDVFLQAALDTGDEDRAHAIKSIVHGLIALGQILAAEDEELAAVMQVVRGIEIDTDDSTLILEIVQDVDDVLEFIQEAVNADGELNWEADEDYDDEEDDDDDW